jgi:H+-translocating diphosphatase
LHRHINKSISQIDDRSWSISTFKTI